MSEAVSNRVLAILIAIFTVTFLIETSLYVSYAKITFRAHTGMVKFCLDNNPDIEPIPDMTAYVDELFTYDVNVTGAGNGSVTFYDYTDLFDINPSTGLIQFTPGDEDIGEYYINISVTSACGRMTDLEVFKLTIELENDPPVLDPVPDFVINQSSLFIYDVNATDPNNDTLFFGDNSTMFQINSDTGLIYFVPEQEDVGNHSVMIWVMDEHNAIDWDISMFEILDVNDPPVLDTIGAQTAIIYENYTYDVNATDVDVKPEWSNLTYYDNATFFDIDPKTGMIEFYVNETYNGTYWINISVTDGEFWDYEVISFSVVFVNHPPNITSWYPENDTIEINEGESQYFNITKFDLDGTIPSTQWYLNGNELKGETADEYVYYASYSSSGTHNITVVISDGEFTDSHEWTLIVRDVPQPSGAAAPPSAGEVPPPCVENWRCSEWSVCPVYGIQTRECWDLNECGTTFNKPEVTRPCVYVPEPSCEDGVVNCHHGGCEIWIDCGGPCPPCPTCSDGVRNCHTLENGEKICEEGMDCGGPCPPCPSYQPPVCGNGICEEGELSSCPQDCGLFFVQFLLIVVVLGGASILTYRISYLLLTIYRSRIRPPPYAPLELLGIVTLRKLHLIQLEIGKKRTRRVVSEFSGVMREFFTKRFNMRRKFTYIELSEAVRRKKMDRRLVSRIEDFSMKMTEMEYRHAEPSVSELALAVKNAIAIVERLTGVRMKDIFERRAEEEMKRAERKEKVELPKPVPRKEMPKYEPTEKDIKMVKTLERLIAEGERAIAEHRVEEAENIYTKIREIYDDIHPEVKRGLYNETIRIIKLYNRIMDEISGGTSPS